MNSLLFELEEIISESKAISELFGTIAIAGANSGESFDTFENGAHFVYILSVKNSKKLEELLEKVRVSEREEE